MPRRIPNAIASSVSDSKIVLDLGQGVYYDLQGVGGEIWEMLASPISEEEIVSRLLEVHDDARREQVEADVAAFLKDLGEHGLLA